MLNIHDVFSYETIQQVGIKSVSNVWKFGESPIRVVEFQRHPYATRLLKNPPASLYVVTDINEKRVWSNFLAEYDLALEQGKQLFREWDDDRSAGWTNGWKLGIDHWVFGPFYIQFTASGRMRVRNFKKLTGYSEMFVDSKTMKIGDWLMEKRHLSVHLYNTFAAEKIDPETVNRVIFLDGNIDNYSWDNLKFTWEENPPEQEKVYWRNWHNEPPYFY